MFVTLRGIKIKPTRRLERPNPKKSNHMENAINRAYDYGRKFIELPLKNGKLTYGLLPNGELLMFETKSSDLTGFEVSKGSDAISRVDMLIETLDPLLEYKPALKQPKPVSKITLHAALIGALNYLLFEATSLIFGISIRPLVSFGSSYISFTFYWTVSTILNRQKYIMRDYSIDINRYETLKTALKTLSEWREELLAENKIPSISTGVKVKASGKNF